MKPFFATENLDDPDAVNGMALRRAHHAVFRHYAEDGEEFYGSADHDTEMARLRSTTGLPLNEVKSGVYSYMTLASLPRLRQLQEDTARLDISRLKAIDRAVSMLGSVVDQEALIEALQHDAIAGAALDVFADEPRIPQELCDLDTVVITPHVASATHETRRAMADVVLANIDAHRAGQELPTRVN